MPLRFWLETVRIKWNEVTVAYPKKYEYKGKRTSYVPETLLTVGGVLGALYAGGVLKVDHINHAVDILKQNTPRLLKA